MKFNEFYDVFSMLSIIFLKNEQVQKGEIVPQIIQKKINVRLLIN